jgi:hypothetical protein
MDFTGLSVLPLLFWEFAFWEWVGCPLFLRCVVDGESEFGWNSAISAWNYEYQLTASC